MIRTTLTLLTLTATIPALAQSFTCGSPTKSATPLTPATLFTDTTPGFDLSTLPTIAQQSCSSDQPFFFSIPLPEGNYRVTVVLGGPQAATTTVRAEARRLMLEKIPTAPGAAVTRTFDTNLRVPEMSAPADSPASAERVKLKPREIGNLDWDNKLTLEFNGEHPSVRSISITPIHEPTLYLAGDSTVVDQDVEPWAAWGQMLPRFFSPGIVIANHAVSGETIRSFVSEQRFAKIFSLIQPGDYLFLQFNHNDQKINPKTHEAAVPIEDYKQLFTEYIAKARAAGATPVLVTAMNRRTFDSVGHITNSLGDFPQAVRELAASQHVALIDLNAMSKTLFETLGPDVSTHAFMHYAANTYPNQTDPISDDTHFNSYGAYELARCIVHGIRADHLSIVKFLDPSVPDFDPAHPDPISTFHLPATPIRLKTNVMTIPQV